MAASKTEFLGYLQPGTQLHEYAIERVLGHGGFGITYLARDTLLDKPVAIKEYLPTDLAMRAGLPQVVLRTPDLREAFIWGREQFLKEARTLARFSHPNLITVHRFFEANDTAYFVMEYAQGQTLAQILKREVMLPFDRLQAMLYPVLEGLGQVHRSGVLHRDIKPDNIMLRADGQPVLIDFGAARMTLGSKTRSVLSVLTAGYAPLEQYGSAGANQGPWTDIYALGAVAYRAITGKKPTDAVNRVHNDPLTPAIQVGRDSFPEPFLRAVDWALCVVPEQRPRSIEEWRAALEGQAPVPEHAMRSMDPADTGSAVPLKSSGDGPDWQKLAESAAQEYAEFSGSVPESHADSPSDPIPLPSRSRSLTSIPSVAPSRKSNLIATAITLFLIFGLFEYMLHSASQRQAERASATAAAARLTPGLAPGTQLGQKLTTTLSRPPPAGVPPAGSDGAAPPAAATGPSAAADPGPAPAAAATTPATEKPARNKSSTPTLAAEITPLARLKAGGAFSDCDRCPQMIVLGAGTPLDPTTNAWERPAHKVAIPATFAIARRETTVSQWKACVAAGGCPAGASVGRDGSLPAIDVSWNDARAYAAWLSKFTGRKYRLPTEAEWEYAARAGTTTTRFWGEDRNEQCAYGNGADQAAREDVERGVRVAECDDKFERLAPVGSYAPNAFGLYDMVGNAWEWVQDCWRDSYADAPNDGSAIDGESCPTRVIRGGSWRAKPESLRSFSRGLSTPDHRGDDLGFRVAAE